MRLDLRVSVATGEAVAAADATDQSMVTGEVAILAARLQSAARRRVVVSEETSRILDPLLEAEPMRELALKGFPRPVTAYRVTGMRTASGRPRGIPGLSSPVVGRDAEMRTLRGCIDDLRRGAGGGVDRGRASIGRSRLKIESARACPRACAGSKGVASRSRRARATRPLIEVLRSALGVGTADPQPIARTKLRAALRSLTGAQAEQHQTALAHLLGVDLGASGARALDPRALQAGIIVTMRAVLKGLTQRGPVVLAVEDIHWATRPPSSCSPS